MLDLLRFTALGTAWLAAQAPAYLAFRRALERPEAAQEKRLRAILRANTASDYGRACGFDRIGTIREYQDALPIMAPPDLAPWTEAIAAGLPRVLTTEPVLAFETTGGSSGEARLIPYTRSLLREFQQALGAWMIDLHLHRPGLSSGGAYWSVSPPAAAREITAGGIRVGLEHDIEYFPRAARWALARLMLAPAELAEIGDVATSRYVTLRFLAATPHLTFVSVWNPTFLTLLIDALGEWAPAIVDDIERGRLSAPAALDPALARRLESRLRRDPRRPGALRARLRETGRLRPSDVWPRLRLISCWTSAAAARFVPEVIARFPGVEIQGKGLLATEGVVSIPLVGHPGAALAVTSHVYEFGDPDAPSSRPRLVHELEPGRTYTVIVTTGGGLYRYALGDLVRVVGHVGRTPLVEFVGRTGNVSDLCGEKLAEPHVRTALETAASMLGLGAPFLMLAPEWGPPPHYTVFAGAADLDPARLRRLTVMVDGELSRNPSYAWCRTLGQLGPVRGCRVGRNAAETYVARCAELGQRTGVVKPTYLHTVPGWTDVMGGELV